MKIMEFSLKGKQAFLLDAQTLAAITDWCRNMHHAVFGPEEGEARYKACRLVDALELWTSYGHLTPEQTPEQDSSEIN